MVTINETLYRKHVLRARSTRNHFTFCRDYVIKLKMKKLTALFFQDILNLASLEKTKRKEINGKDYFLCSRKYLNRSMDWDDDAQKTQLANLKACGFVDVQLKGMPKRRWVYIDILAVEQALDRGEPLPEKPDGGKVNRPEGEKPPVRKPNNPPSGRAVLTPVRKGVETPVKKEQEEERTKNLTVLSATPTVPNGNGKHAEASSMGEPAVVAEVLVKKDKRRGRLAEALALMDEWSTLVWETFKIRPEYYGMQGDDRFKYAGKVKNGIDGIAGGVQRILTEAGWYCKKYKKVKRLPTQVTNLLQFLHPNTFGWISGRHEEYERKDANGDGEWNRI